MSDWIHFATAAQRLRSKYGGREEAARALRAMALTGDIASLAAAALHTTGVDFIGSGGRILEKHTNWPVPLDVWAATSAPSLTSKDWRSSTFVAVGGWGLDRWSIALSNVQLDRSKVEGLLSLPDQPVSLADTLDERRPSLGSSSMLDRIQAAARGDLLEPQQGMATLKPESGARAPVRKGRRRKSEWGDWAAALTILAWDGEIKGSMTNTDVRTAVNDKLAEWGLDEMPKTTVEDVVAKILDRLRAADI